MGAGYTDTLTAPVLLVCYSPIHVACLCPRYSLSSGFGLCSLSLFFSYLYFSLP